MRPLLGGTVLTALLTAAAPAAASHAHHDCRLVVTADPTREDGWQTGALTGYAVSPTLAESVSIYCWLQVNGEYLMAWEGMGGQAMFLGPLVVTFPATPSDFVQVCHTWTAGSEFGTSCRAATVV